jgi:hypothetical protein
MVYTLFHARTSPVNARVHRPDEKPPNVLNSMPPLTSHDLDGQLLLSKASLSRNTDSRCLYNPETNGVVSQSRGHPGEAWPIDCTGNGGGAPERGKISRFLVPEQGSVGVQPIGRGGVVQSWRLSVWCLARSSEPCSPRNDRPRDFALTCGFSSIWLDHGLHVKHGASR